jgi:hypothetical protein
VSRPWFVLLVALLAVVVAVGSFFLVLTLLDDDDSPVTADDESTSTSTEPSTTTPPSPLETPAWVTILSSERDEAAAAQVADRVAATGRTTGVLRSDGYSSLTPGFWVPYVGPFPGRAQAEAEVGALAADGIGGAYARCVGTTEQCRAAPG